MLTRTPEAMVIDSFASSHIGNFTSLKMLELKVKAELLVALGGQVLQLKEEP
jgi:hypothetical protein